MSLIDWNSLPKAAGMRAGSVRQAVCAEQMSAVRVETAPDAAFDGKTHWHDNEQMLVMISGEVTLVIDDQTVVCRPGDLVFFPRLAPRRHRGGAARRGVLRDIRPGAL